MASEHHDPGSFWFTLGRVAEADKDLGMQIAALEARMDKLVKATELNGIPILGHILGLSHDPEELARLAKALDRVAPLIAQHDKLKARKAVLETAKNEPNFLAWAFGDFGQELDAFTKEINPGEE